MTDILLEILFTGRKAVTAGLPAAGCDGLSLTSIRDLARRVVSSPSPSGRRDPLGAFQSQTTNAT
jgi:hypothetical protein